jgi:hypothetical protein
MHTDQIIIPMTKMDIPDVLGPQCESFKHIGCWHESCLQIELNGCIVLAEGPMCESQSFFGECGHVSCLLPFPDQDFCGRHGWQQITSRDVSQGFAGGRIYWADLTCGCQNIDESDDIRAAY